MTAAAARGSATSPTTATAPTANAGASQVYVATMGSRVGAGAPAAADWPADAEAAGSACAPAGESCDIGT
jgi:hypothetical protein